MPSVALGIRPSSPASLSQLVRLQPRVKKGKTSEHGKPKGSSEGEVRAGSVARDHGRQFLLWGGPRVRGLFRPDYVESLRLKRNQPDSPGGGACLSWVRQSDRAGEAESW